MADTLPITYFESTAGLVLVHPAGRYAELRYRPGQRQPGDLSRLLTQLGRVLLQRGWHTFLADNRQMAPFTDAEKQWFVTHWLGGEAPRPTPLTGVVVLPENVFARLSFQELYLQATTVQYRIFTDLPAAQACLATLA